MVCVHRVRAVSANIEGDGVGFHEGKGAPVEPFVVIKRGLICLHDVEVRRCDSFDKVALRPVVCNIV